MESIVFAVENDLHKRAVFLKHVAGLKAMGKLAGDVVECVGMWVDDHYNEVMEPSYMMLAVDYDKHVKPFGFTDSQVCVLRVPSDNRQPCTIDMGGVRLSVGHWVEGRGRNGWTYLINEGKYFTTEE